MPNNFIRGQAALAAHAQKLAALGYETTEQLKGVAAAAGKDLASYLGVGMAELNTLLAGIPSAAAAPAAANQPPPFRLGALLDRIPPIRQAFAVSAPPPVQLPPMVNLINEMQPIRDQQQRGTCVAFSSAAAAEHYWQRVGTIVDLSPQFLYCDCKQHDGTPTQEGTWIAVAMPLLQNDGCCQETTWPYVPNDIAGNEGQGPAPAPAITEAPTYRVPSFRQLAPTSVSDIKAELAADKCVAFTIPVFNSWYRNGVVTSTGEIVNPVPGEQSIGGHAMCMVGYEDLPGNTALGEGMFYIRNSWGSAWATASTLGVVGYGKIPYSYIDRFGAEAYSIG